MPANGLRQIRALVAYNAWADGHILEAASALSQEQLELKLQASFDSVQGNLWHALNAQTVWLQRFQGIPTGALPRAEAGLTLKEIRRAYEDSQRAYSEFAESLTEEGLDRALSYTDTRGVAQERVLWQMMLHVVNHGTHHRAETAMLLTSLGRPPRQLDYLFYEIELAGGAPRLT